MPYDASYPYDYFFAYDIGNPQISAVTGPSTSQSFATVFYTTGNVPEGVFGINSSQSFSPVSWSAPSVMDVTGPSTVQAFSQVQFSAPISVTVSGNTTRESFGIPSVAKTASLPLLVQSNKNNSIVGTSGQIPFVTSNITAGNVIVVAASISAPTSITAVDDSAGNIYTKSITNIDTGISTVTIWYAPIIAGAGTKPTISIHTSGTNLVFAFIWEFSGLNNASLFDVPAVSSGVGAVGSSPSSTTLTTTYVNDLLVGICMCAGTLTGTTAGWTVFTGSANPKLDAEIFVATSAGPYAATFTQTTVSSYNSALAVLRSVPMLPVNMSRVL